MSHSWKNPRRGRAGGGFLAESGGEAGAPEDPPPRPVPSGAKRPPLLGDVVRAPSDRADGQVVSIDTAVAVGPSPSSTTKAVTRKPRVAKAAWIICLAAGSEVGNLIQG